MAAINQKIYESVVTTCNEDRTVHIAPMGMWRSQDLYVLAPFRPSRTLDNLERSGVAVINFTDQVKIFAGCLTGRYDWPVTPATMVDGFVLDQALAHVEVKVVRKDDDGVRPCFYCRRLFEQIHSPYGGMNRAKAAVLELAILVSRLDRLSDEKIEGEIAYLSIAIDKTAGPDEREAWAWLMARVHNHRNQSPGTSTDQVTSST